MDNRAVLGTVSESNGRVRVVDGCIGLPSGNNLLEVFLIPSAKLAVDRNGQSIEFVCRGCESSRMNETLLGILIGVAGTFLIEAFSGSRILRAQRKQNLKEIYAQFARSINKGLRLVEDLEKISRDSTQLSKEYKTVAKRPNSRAIEIIDKRLSRLADKTNKIELEVDAFLADTDATLSYFQLAAPKHVLSAGVAIRTGIDDCLNGKVDFVELQKRYSCFITVARFSLRNQFLGWCASKISNRL